VSRQIAAQDRAQATLRRSLGLRDVVLLIVALVVAPRWLATAAQLGPVSLLFWVAGLLLFFLPCCVAVRELARRLPGEGGIYRWTQAAFGDSHGFVVGWTYWVTNMFYLPSVLLLAASWSLYVGGSAWLSLADDTAFNLTFALAVIWLATLLNIIGLERAKWLNNVGGAANWLVLILVAAAAAIALARLGAATQFTARSLLPVQFDSSTIGVFAAIAFAYAGVEASAIAGDEIRDVARTLSKAIWIAGALIAVVYAGGTLALLVALEPQQIDPVAGMASSFYALETRAACPGLGVVGAVVLTASQIGNVSGWITSTARLPFVAGIDRHLPAAFGRVHRRWGTPYVALLVQAVLSSAVLCAALTGSSIREAFQQLLDATMVLAFLPLLYMFAALPVLAARDGAGVGPRDGVAAAVGFAVTALALALALIPPDGTEHPALFVTKTVVGSGVLVGVGVVQYRRSRRRDGIRAAE